MAHPTPSINLNYCLLSTVNFSKRKTQSEKVANKRGSRALFPVSLFLTFLGEKEVSFHLQHSTQQQAKQPERYLYREVDTTK